MPTSAATVPMPAPPAARRRTPWWRRGSFWLSLATLLIGLVIAAFVIAARLLPDYRHDIEREVSRAVGRPVALGQIGLTWRWAQPMLQVRDASVLAADGRRPLLNVERVRLGFSLAELLRGRVTPSEINVQGVALVFDVDADGRIALRGFGDEQREPPTPREVLDGLRRFARIKASAVSVSLNDVRLPQANFAAVVQEADLRIEARGLELRAQLTAPGVLAERLTLRAGLAGDLDGPLEALAGQWALDADALDPGPAVILRAPPLRGLVLDGASLKASGAFTGSTLGPSEAQFQAAQLGFAGGGAPAPLRNVAFTLAYAPAASATVVGSGAGGGNRVAAATGPLRSRLWQRGGTLQLRNLQLVGGTGAWPTASAALSWQPVPDGWSFDLTADYLRLDDLGPLVQRLSHPLETPATRRSGMRGSVAGAVTATVAAGTGVKVDPAPATDWFALAGTATGVVQGLEAHYLPAPAGQAADGTKSPPRYSLRARLLDVGIGARSIEPGGLGARASGVHGLGGDLQADQQGGRFALAGDGARLVLGRAFDVPVRFDALRASLRWQREGPPTAVGAAPMTVAALPAAPADALSPSASAPASAPATDDVRAAPAGPPSTWRITAPDLAWRAEGTEGRAKLDLHLGGGSPPRLDLVADFAAADAARLKPLMPHRWGPGLKEWLGRSIVRAAVPKGHLVIAGPLADFPFHKRPTGRWALDLAVREARLDYLPDWPGVEGLATDLEFRGNGFAARQGSGRSLGLAASGVEATIADFTESPLELVFSVAGEAERGYDFLRAAPPLRTQLRGLLEHTQGFGPVRTDLRITVPLHKDRGETLRVGGLVRLDGNRLRVNALDEPVEAVRGSLRFGTEAAPGNVAAEGLQGVLHGTPVTVAIAPGPDGVDTLGARFTARVDEDTGVAGRYVPAWVRANLTGSAAWRLQLPLSGPTGGQVLLSSALVGVTSRLPPPLAKTAAEPMPLGLAIVGGESPPLRISLAVRNRLGLTLRFARAAGALVLRGASVAIGTSAAAAGAGTAAEDGLRVTAALERLDPAEWLGLIGGIVTAGKEDGAAADGGGAAAKPGLPFLGAQVTARHLAAAGYETDALGIDARPAPDGALLLGFTGAGAAGSASLSADRSRVTASLQRLALKRVPEPEQAASVSPADAPLPAVAAAAREALQPARLPALDVQVGELRIGDVPFGALTFRTARDGAGQTLETFRLADGTATVEASGYWRRRGAAAEAATRFRLRSDDLAAVLRGLGFEATVSGRDARIEGDLAWQAPTGGLALAQARGTLTMEAENGSLRSVDPGAGGRVLGLLNLYALPRRLALDFRDVTRKGLAYDRIAGGFELGDGKAVAKEVTVKGPAVRMKITGTVGLAARTLDQTVTVTPNTAGATLGAVLLGGATLAIAPPVGLLAIIANQVLDKPIGKATEFSYRVTGPWDDPEIRREDGSVVRATGQDEAAATGTPPVSPAAGAAAVVAEEGPLPTPPPAEPAAATGPASPEFPALPVTASPAALQDAAPDAAATTEPPTASPR